MFMLGNSSKIFKSEKLKIFQHRCNLLSDLLNFVYTSVHILYLGQVPKEGGR